MAKKLKKYPKKPKLSSDIKVWQAWEKRAAAVKKYNDAIKKERDAKVRIANKF